MRFYRFIILFILVVSARHGFAEFPSYLDTDLTNHKLIFVNDIRGLGAYLDAEFLVHIDKSEVSSILEIGSRDGRDAIHLSEYYKCHVFAFECNPQCLAVCRRNVDDLKNVTLVEYAAWNETQDILFYPVIAAPGKYYDPGSSACFPMNDRALQYYTQSVAITVPATRLDDWITQMDIDHIDLLCMDTQGATLNILEGMGDYLIKTKYIITECVHRDTYIGERLFPDLVEFLHAKGFELIPSSHSIDFLFINTREDFN